MQGSYHYRVQKMDISKVFDFYNYVLLGQRISIWLSYDGVIGIGIRATENSTFCFNMTVVVDDIFVESKYDMLSHFIVVFGGEIYDINVAIIKSK